MDTRLMLTELPKTAQEFVLGEDLTESAVRSILLDIGEDPQREGLVNTPARVRRMFEEITAGSHVDAEKLINGAIFDVDYDDMVLVKNIEFYSLCEHHMLPFFGRAAVAYIPDGKVIGLSKIPRIVEMFARRLQVQERMTQQIAAEAVRIVAGRVALEAPGNVTLANVREIAETGVNMISVGALTHSVTAADISLKIAQ